jgi:hypothetical protein
MTLFIISIPLMLVAVGIAVVPLIAMSRSEMREITGEVEGYLERQRLAHQADRARQLHIDAERLAGAPAPLDGNESQPRVPALVGQA